MAKLPQRVTAFTGIECRGKDSTTIATSATTSAAYIHSEGDIEADGNLYVDGTATLTGAVGVTGALTVTGALNANGALNVGQGLTVDVTTCTTGQAVYTVLATDNVIVVPAAGTTSTTIMIATALATAGNVFHVITAKGATTAVVIDVAGGTIGGQAAGTGVTCADDGCISLVSDGTNWYLMGGKGKVG